jgi:hypothetical protein
MKRIKITALVLAVLICPAVFAEEGFTAKVDVDTNLVQFFHQDIQNDTYIDNAVMPRTDSVYFMRNPNYDDVDLTMQYTDPDDRYGGTINFAFSATPDKYFTLGDLFGWVRISRFFRGKLGIYTDRLVEKVGGDKDLGVLLFGIDKANSDLTFSTSDSLGLGSAAIGFLPTAIIPLGDLGEVNVSGFFAPNEYYLAQKTTNSYDQSYGASVMIPAYATYKFGGSLKYTFPEYLTLGAAYRTAHSEPVTTTDIGFISHDIGVYGIVTLPFGLKTGIGYSGNLVYEDKDDDDQEIRKPLKSAIHLDLGYGGIPRLNIGLYNNVSFYTVEKADTIGYIAEADRLNPNLFGDEESLVLYNEVSVSYDVTETFTPTLMVRNYYGSLNNLDGGKGQDYSKNTFIVEVLARYKINDNIQARGGVKFEKTDYGTPVSSQVLQNSNYAVSIPIGLTVSW